MLFLFSLQDVLNNLGSSELDEDDLMLDLDLSDDQRHRHGNFITSLYGKCEGNSSGNSKMQMVQIFLSRQADFLHVSKSLCTGTHLTMTPIL